MTAKKIRLAINILLITAFLSSGAYVFYFLTGYFYPAITGSQTIYALQKNMAAESINLKNFNKLLDTAEKKNLSSPNTPYIHNPFTD